MILAQRALDFFPCNTKQEINLTLAYVSVFYSCLYHYSIGNGSIINSLSNILNTAVLTHKKVHQTIFVTIKILVYFISFMGNCANKCVCLSSISQTKHCGLLHLKDPTTLSVWCSFALTKWLLNFLEILNETMGPE